MLWGDSVFDWECHTREFSSVEYTDFSFCLIPVRPICFQKSPTLFDEEKMKPAKTGTEGQYQKSKQKKAYFYRARLLKFFWHCISWCLWERFVNLVVSDIKGILSNRGIMSRFSWKKKKKIHKRKPLFIYLSHLCQAANQALSVRAASHQDHLCQETWHYISFLDWIASSPTDCFQCKMISGIRRYVLSCSALHCWLQKTWDTDGGWAGIILWDENFWHKHNCVLFCSARKTACVTSALALEIGRGKKLGQF